MDITLSSLLGGLQLGSATPQPLGTAGAGSSAFAARQDHVHAMPTAAAVGADPAGTGAAQAAAAVSAHTALADPHPQYLTAAEGNAAYGSLSSANSWAGVQTFASDNTNLQSSAPRINWIEADAAADSGRWRMQANASVFELFAYNDAGNVFTPVFQVSRSGTTVSNFNVRANDLQINGVPVARGATTVGNNILTAANPSAVRFIRVNADNTVSFLDAASMLSAIGGVGPTVTIRTANAATNFALTDRGNAVAKDDTGSYVWTILNDATTLWADNATILCCNDGAGGNVTITPGSGVTLTAGTVTGAFVLEPGQSRLLHRRAANNWRIR